MSGSEPGLTPIVRFELFTIFPGIFHGPLDESIVKRAQERGLVTIGLHDIRDWTRDRHRTVDDTPYGGGAGMVMKAPPVVSAVGAGAVLRRSEFFAPLQKVSRGPSLRPCLRKRSLKSLRQPTNCARL